MLLEDSKRQSGEKGKDQISEGRNDNLRNLTSILVGDRKSLRISEKRKVVAAEDQKD